MDAGRSASPLEAAIERTDHLSRTFDGNRSDLITNWFFRTPGMTVKDHRKGVERLMSATLAGNLDWVVIPADVA